MTKQELIEKIAERTNSTKVTAAKHLDAFLEIVTENLSTGDKVTLVGFGAFEAVQKDARIGRNPATGESIDIPAKRVPKFIPGKQLKEAVAK
ncbi:MAG: HU family DNA-binding protein [Burkholderiales bacterium]|nr:HU family DNA-binding protein [Burkholderiales bacterium]